ncbi:MAG: GTP-dependent dephospho-CoA kinase family protein [Candidatus Brockarchaeota archaeon]|nr:GTP-dependent dephospho-CoA kinase family protein [Candidatus Brockarchaeota archaeon]
MPPGDLKLRQSQRALLKRPIGSLIPGSGDAAWRGVLEAVSKLKPKAIVAVGDETSMLFARKEFGADLYVVDGAVMRKRVAGEVFKAKKVLRLRNPPGSISGKAWETVRKGLSIGGGAAILVEGEEDLLALVAVLEAPLGSLVFYGQPGEGLVAVQVTEAKKEELRKIVDGMEGAGRIRRKREGNVFQRPEWQHGAR